MGWDGFDNVELVMELEDRLEISISDSDATSIRNPGQLVDYLSRRLNATDPSILPRCRSADAFRTGRCRLATAFGRSALLMRPTTPISKLLPDASQVARRRDEWARLSGVLGVKLPGLEHPVIYRCAALGSGAVIFILSILLASHSTDVVGSSLPFAGMVTALAVGVPSLLLMMGRRWLAGNVPKGFETLGDVLSCSTFETIPECAQSPSGTWTRHELWELVRDLTALNAGCPPSHIRRETKWTSL